MCSFFFRAWGSSRQVCAKLRSDSLRRQICFCFLEMTCLDNGPERLGDGFLLFAAKMGCWGAGKRGGVNNYGHPAASVDLELLPDP
jgi:hypothetical protein